MSFTASVLVQPSSSNQDRAATFETPSGLVVVVADGAGGMGGGAEAADAVVDCVRRATLAGRLSNWTSVLREVDIELRDQGQTTAVVVEVSGTGLLGASVGDSQAWIFSAASRSEVTCHQERKPLVGSGRAKPVAFMANIGEGGIVVVGTDGLFNYSTVNEISKLAMEDRPLADYIELVQLPTGGLQDDVAIVVCRGDQASDTHNSS